MYMKMFDVNKSIERILKKNLMRMVMMNNVSNEYLPSFMVILLGPDRIGKDTFITTLYSWIKDRYKYNGFYVHRYNDKLGVVFDDSIKRDEEILNDSLNLLNGESNVVILNRSYLDEYVYGQIYRGMSVEEVSYYKVLEGKYGLDRYDNIFLVHLYASASFCSVYNLMNCGENRYYKDMKFVELVEKFKVELKLFNDVYDGSIIRNKVKINVSDPNKDYRFKDREKILNYFLVYLYDMIKNKKE